MAADYASLPTPSAIHPFVPKRQNAGSLGVGPRIPALHEPKNVFRPMGWGKLAISFWCDGLVRERLDRRRTANVAADVAAAPVDECGQVCV